VGVGDALTGLSSPGRVVPTRLKQIQICAELGFFGQIQNMLVRTFFAFILTSLIPILTRRAAGAAGGVRGNDDE
jgi:hypothetical protein